MSAMLKPQESSPSFLACCLQDSESCPPFSTIFHTLHWRQQFTNKSRVRVIHAILAKLAITKLNKHLTIKRDYTCMYRERERRDREGDGQTGGQVTPKNLFPPRISFLVDVWGGRCHAKHMMKLTYGEHPAKIWHTSCAA